MNPDDGSQSNTPAALALFGVSAAFLASAIYGFDQYGECRRFRREYEARQAQAERDEELRRESKLAWASALEKQQRDRARAWQLTKQAESAARAGDCATVTALDPQIRALDAELHAVVFTRDAGIARCLSGSP